MFWQWIACKNQGLQGVRKRDYNRVSKDKKESFPRRDRIPLFMCMYLERKKNRASKLISNGPWMINVLKIDLAFLSQPIWIT